MQQREVLSWCLQFLAGTFWVISVFLYVKIWEAGDVFQLMAAASWVLSSIVTFPGPKNFGKLCMTTDAQDVDYEPSSTQPPNPYERDELDGAQTSHLPGSFLTNITAVSPHRTFKHSSI
eukprot:m.95714 g.95714  ORF g.95714 m.95714 type:complete len:119 (-) comp26843_c0_seq1:532-888(-)